MMMKGGRGRRFVLGEEWQWAGCWMFDGGNPRVLMLCGSFEYWDPILIEGGSVGFAVRC